MVFNGLFEENKAAARLSEHLIIPNVLLFYLDKTLLYS